MRAALLIAFLFWAIPARADKLDIYGSRPGEPFEQVFANPNFDCRKHFPPRTSLNFNDWRCEGKNGTSVNLTFSSDLPNKPLLIIQVNFQSADAFENVLASVSAQYGRSPKKISERFFRFDLSNGTTLELIPGSLYLKDDALIKQAEEAAQRNAVKRNPTPKF